MTYATITKPSKNLKGKGATTVPLHTTIHTTSTSVCSSLKTRASTLIPTTSYISAFDNFITQEVMDTKIEAWSRDKGEHSTYS